MPIKIPNNLPATNVLEGENIFVMNAARAYSQDIRPLRILILNLMPIKDVTETQLLRLLGNTPLQVEVDFIYTESYIPSHTSRDYLTEFYGTFAEVRHKKYDGFIITGAPVEQMEFERVAYWDEVAEIMQWSRKHAYSTFHICWGAQAGLYYHYGIPKYWMDKKIFGVYEHRICVQHESLLRGFDDAFYVPHSRHTETRREYDRDLAAGMTPDIPLNYYPDDDPNRLPVVRWRSVAHLLFANWLNYYVYQGTPYELDSLDNAADD